MPKGKKFNAAEKHFQKRCVEWRKKIKEVEETNKLLHKTICDNIKEIERLEMENEYLKQQNDALMEIKDISVDDIKTLIESKESINNISNLLNIMTKRTF